MYNINVNEMIPIHGIATRPFSTCPSNLNFKPKFNHTNPLHCQLISICNNQSRILRRFCLRVTVLLLPFSRMFNLPIEVGHHAPKREQQRNPFFGLKLFFVENNRQHFGYRQQHRNQNTRKQRRGTKYNPNRPQEKSLP